MPFGNGDLKSNFFANGVALIGMVVLSALVLGAAYLLIAGIIDFLEALV